MKRQAMDWEKILVKLMSDKGLVFFFFIIKEILF